jgi:hypothetical protein
MLSVRRSRLCLNCWKTETPGGGRVVPSPVFMTSFLADLCGGELRHIDSLPRHDPLFSSAKAMESVFTALVDRLRSPSVCHCPPINDLMSLFWRLVGNRICPASISSVTSISFWCEVKDSNYFATVMCPQNWLQMLKEDKTMQLGGMVFQASRAKDYWNRIFPGRDCPAQDSFDRACSYEAEFLNYLLAEDQDFSPNVYQQQVLEKFPKGLSSARPGLHYEGRSFPISRQEIILAGPPFPVDV